MHQKCTARYGWRTTRAHPIDISARNFRDGTRIDIRTRNFPTNRAPIRARRCGSICTWRYYYISPWESWRTCLYAIILQARDIFRQLISESRTGEEFKIFYTTPIAVSDLRKLRLFFSERNPGNIFPGFDLSTISLYTLEAFDISRARYQCAIAGWLTGWLALAVFYISADRSFIYGRGLVSRSCIPTTIGIVTHAFRRGGRAVEYRKVILKGSFASE